MAANANRDEGLGKTNIRRNERIQIFYSPKECFQNQNTKFQLTYTQKTSGVFITPLSPNTATAVGSYNTAELPTELATGRVKLRQLNKANHTTPGLCWMIPPSRSMKTLKYYQK